MYRIIVELPNVLGSFKPSFIPFHKAYNGYGKCTLPFVNYYKETIKIFLQVSLERISFLGINQCKTYNPKSFY